MIIDLRGGFGAPPFATGMAPTVTRPLITQAMGKPTVATATAKIPNRWVAPRKGIPFRPDVISKFDPGQNAANRPPWGLGFPATRHVKTALSLRSAGEVIGAKIAAGQASARPPLDQVSPEQSKRVKELAAKIGASAGKAVRGVPVSSQTRATTRGQPVTYMRAARPQDKAREIMFGARNRPATSIEWMVKSASANFKKTLDRLKDKMADPRVNTGAYGVPAAGNEPSLQKMRTPVSVSVSPTISPGVMKAGFSSGKTWLYLMAASAAVLVVYNLFLKKGGGAPGANKSGLAAA